MIEKSNFNSKKFVAFFISLAILASILIVALITQTFGWAMVTFMSVGILAISVMCISYVNKQGTLDKFIETIKTVSKVNLKDEDNK